jgi:hypothetical protein
LKASSTHAASAVVRLFFIAENAMNPKRGLFGRINVFQFGRKVVAQSS